MACDTLAAIFLRSLSAGKTARCSLRLGFVTSAPLSCEGGSIFGMDFGVALPFCHLFFCFLRGQMFFPSAGLESQSRPYLPLAGEASADPRHLPTDSAHILLPGLPSPVDGPESISQLVAFVRRQQTAEWLHFACASLRCESLKPTLCLLKT